MPSNLTEEQDMYVGEAIAAGARYSDIMKFFKNEPRKDDGREIYTENAYEERRPSQRARHP